MALAFVVTPKARAVYGIKPGGNFREYMGAIFKERLYSKIPFPESFAGVTMSGYGFGDQHEQECDELERATRSDGMVTLSLRTSERENKVRHVLVRNGYQS